MENKALVTSGYRDRKLHSDFWLSSIHVFRQARKTCASNVRIRVQSVEVVGQSSKRVEFLCQVFGITLR